MAKTAFLTTDALTRKIWLANNEQLFRDAMKESYFFPKFASDSKNSIVYVKNELTKEKGDNITFGIRMRLLGTGVTSGTALEGKEESLTTFNYNVSLEEFAHAVRDAGPLDRQRSPFDVDMESIDALRDWMSEKIDLELFNALQATGNEPTTVFYNNNGVPTKSTSFSTVKADLNATQDLIVPSVISAMKTWALTGGNRTQTPLRPIMVNGRPHYVLLCHPDVIYDLKQDSTYNQAYREAGIRGDENPIFSGAVGIWDGVVVHEHENVQIGTDAGAGSVPFAHNHFFGAQALCWAWGQRTELVAEEFDYEREHGFAISMISSSGKPKFNSKDYGVIGFLSARTQISDA